LVLEIFDGKDRVGVRIERAPSRNKPVASRSGLKALQMTSAYVRITDDTIRKVGSNFDPDSLREIVVITCHPQTPLLLPEVALICEAISEMAPNYHLFTNQCYWFCAVFLEQVKGKVQFFERRGKDYDYQGKFSDAYQVLNADQAEKDVAKYNEKLQTDAINQDLMTKSVLREGFQNLVEKRKKEAAERKRGTQNDITPLLQTSSAKEAQERAALSSSLSRIISRLVGVLNCMGWTK
jgi:hypothetical protein